MRKALVLLADGFEEIEAVTVVDVLRRAQVEVLVAGLEPGPRRGSHGIEIVTDGSLAEIDPAPFDALILPGGMPGSKTLKEDARVLELVRSFFAAHKLVAAICAAPIALEAAGILAGKRATSFPGNALPSARYSEERLVEDDNVITSRGPGTALEFSLKLVERLVSADAARTQRERMLVA